MTHGTSLDCHVHTAEGSSDSSLRVVDMVRLARSLDLAVALTEHNRAWESFELASLRAESGLLLVQGMEVSTDLGHIVVLGLDRYRPGIRSARKLRELCTETGAFMIAAHPFRHLLERKPGTSEPPFAMEPDEAAERMEIFGLVDGIEVGNGGTAPSENAFAYRVAEILDKPMVGGSDAHSTHGFASFTTRFDDVLTSDAEVIAALRGGAGTCVEGLHLNDPRPYKAEDEIVRR